MEVAVAHRHEVVPPPRRGRAVFAVHNAVRAHDMDRVRILVEQGGTVEERNQFGWTPLHTATYLGHLIMVRFLVESCGANIRARDAKRATALHFATERNHVEIARCLFEFGANPQARDNQGRTAMDVAQAHRRALGVSRLQDAILHRDMVRVRALGGGDHVEHADSYGCRPLHLACAFGSLDMVQYLVETCRANVHAVDHNGETSLHLAVDGQRLETVQYLVESGRADVNATSKDGWTPLHLAAFNNHVESVRYLVELGRANVGLCDSRGRTALDVVARLRGHEAMQLYLHSAGRYYRQGGPA